MVPQETTDAERTGQGRPADRKLAHLHGDPFFDDASMLFGQWQRSCTLPASQSGSTHPQLPNVGSQPLLLLAEVSWCDHASTHRIRDACCALSVGTPESNTGGGNRVVVPATSSWPAPITSSLVHSTKTGVRALNVSRHTLVQRPLAQDTAVAY